MSKINLKRGIGIVEVLVAVSIFTVILGFLITASNLYLSGAGDSLKSAEGSYLAQEGIEAVKTIRDNNWSNIGALSTTTTYYLTFDNSSSTNNIWKATTTATSINSFTRTFNIYDVYRDSYGRIATTSTSTANFDAYTKKITISVSWIAKNGTSGTTTKKTLSAYIADIL
jgi:hypothetical protein